MNERLEISPVKLFPDGVLILRLSLRSLTSETLLLRPTLDEWAIDGDRLVSAISYIKPAYVILLAGNEATQIITLQMPLDLQPGQNLKSWLRFPGILEEAILINVAIATEAPPFDKPRLVEIALQVTFPLTPHSSEILPNAPDNTTAGIFGLLSGLIDLDKIPSSWLAAELLINLCQKGDEYSQTEPGRLLLKQLLRTDFFKNGVSAFSSAKVPSWIAQNLSAAGAALGSDKGKGYLFYIWEQWLWRLVESDLETGESGNEIRIPLFKAEAFVTKLEGSAVRWLAGIVLGLTQVSPRIAAIVNAIATHSPPTSLDNNSAIQASYHLATGLPGLDTLPARWLVIELLLIVCQKGDDYARTEWGRHLLNQLSRTRFFKNGLLALASAQVPRWLSISQSAAIAFRASLGLQYARGGLLYTWEQWLWSLIPADLKAGALQNQIGIPHNTGEALVAELGMDVGRWFGSIALGLSLISPRIAAIIEAIASRAPTASIEVSPPQISCDNVLEEKGSIQR